MNSNLTALVRHSSHRPVVFNSLFRLLGSIVIYSRWKMKNRRKNAIVFRFLVLLVTGMLFATPMMAQDKTSQKPSAQPAQKTVSVQPPDPPKKVRVSQELMSALAVEDVAYFEQLLSTGADPNVILPNSGKTLLMEAKSVALVALLLSNGADPNQRDEEGATALHHAVILGNASMIIPVLVERGANVNAVDANGITPLVHAVVNDKPDLVELLLRLGAKPQIKTKDGQTALNWAEELGFVDIIELLEAAQADSR